MSSLSSNFPRSVGPYRVAKPTNEPTSVLGISVTRKPSSTGSLYTGSRVEFWEALCRNGKQLSDACQWLIIRLPMVFVKVFRYQYILSELHQRRGQKVLSIRQTEQQSSSFTITNKKTVLRHTADNTLYSMESEKLQLLGPFA